MRSARISSPDGGYRVCKVGTDPEWRPEFDAEARSRYRVSCSRSSKRRSAWSGRGWSRLTVATTALARQRFVQRLDPADRRARDGRCPSAWRPRSERRDPPLLSQARIWCGARAGGPLRRQPADRHAPAAVRPRFRARRVDLCLFLNGIPVATAELKNHLTGQNIEHAIEQYRNDRDPKNVTLARRALVHFAVDPDSVAMTTRLEGKATRFLPFNLGHNLGEGQSAEPRWPQDLLPVGARVGEGRLARHPAPLHPRRAPREGLASARGA